MFALEIRDLHKRFAHPAVDGLDLRVRAGEFYALLGPNGAGKTTTLRMVAGLLQPDRGAISIFGVDARRDPVAAKAVTAWVSDEPMIYDKLTPFEYLEFVAGLWGVSPAQAEHRARDLLAWLELEPHAHTRCEGFSKGMRQKVAIAVALLRNVPVLLLDEPTSGLDPRATADFNRLISEVRDRGTAVLMVTHDLLSAADVADRIGFLEGGQIVEEVSAAGAARFDIRALHARFAAAPGSVAA